MIYIEKFIAENAFDLEPFFTNIAATVEYDRKWPVFVVGAHYSEEDYTQLWRDFLGGKKRGRPSNCLRGSYESLERVVGKCLLSCGPISVVSAACTSGAYALFQAAAVSQLTGTPCIVASGSQLAPGHMGEFWFKSFGAISHDTGIPFDTRSKGFRPGVSQTFFVVNSKQTENTVAIVEEMIFHTLPAETTNTGSIDTIFEHLFAEPIEKDICWWNAHSPGTPAGDRAEYEIFNRVVKQDVPISSLKGKYGHSIAGSYLFELGKGIESIQQGVIPPNVGIETPIVDDSRIIVEPRTTTGKTFLKFNMGFGGKSVVSRVHVL